MDDGRKYIPSKSDIYLSGEDVFYIQFNDVFFYIEDLNKENFYFLIFQKLFPDIRFEKIFPLNGKKNVIYHASKNSDTANSIYVVDKDFDDILGRFHKYPNLYYLDRYSIENYLFENNALVEYIVSQNPEKDRQELVDAISVTELITYVGEHLSDLVVLHILAQKWCNHIKNVKRKPEQFFSFDKGKYRPNPDQFQKYKQEISDELYKIDGRLKLTAQKKKLVKEINTASIEFYIKHIPGKYSLKFIKKIIEYKFNISSREFNSFCYCVAGYCQFGSLYSLRDSISEYLISNK